MSKQDALRAVRMFRRTYGHCEARVFASFLRQKRRCMSYKNRLAFSQAYVATKGDPWPK